MKQVTSVLEFANAAAVERINYELVKVIENIQNPNTDEKPRKLVVELVITPVNNRTTVNINTIAIIKSPFLTSRFLFLL